jgi:hypothetical protein
VKYFKLALTAVCSTLVLACLAAGPASAAGESHAICSDPVAAAANPDVCNTLKGDQKALFGANASPVTKALNVMFIVIGMISVGMIIFGGITYATSAGESSRTTMGRHAITYAVVGLVVAMSAFAIVNFLIARVL